MPLCYLITVLIGIPVRQCMSVGIMSCRAGLKSVMVCVKVEFLSPYLFCVYADELSRMLNNVNAGCFVGGSLVNHLMYADDLVLLAPSAAGLSLLLSACSYYGIEFDVKYNSTKSNVMVFCCNLLKDIPVPNFMLNGVPIDKVSNCKYIGHCINDKLIDDDDMARQHKQIYAQGNALVRKFYMCTETVRMSLFKSYCSSLYTSALWCNYRSESLRKLCVAYNNVFRKITFLPRNCSASLMFATRDLPTCNMLIRKHACIIYEECCRISQCDPAYYCTE